MLQDPQQVHRQHFAQRGLLVRLRLVHRDLCHARWATAIEEFCQARPVRQAPDRPRLALHGVHELLGQAGAEGRRGDRRHLGRPVRISVVKNAHLQGHPRRDRRTIWASTSSYRAAPSSTTRCCAALSRSWARDVIRPTIAGLMGAYGAALHAQGHRGRRNHDRSIDAEALDSFDAQGAHRSTARPVRQPLPADGQHLRRRPPLHLRQPLRAAAGGTRKAAGPAESVSMRSYELLSSRQPFRRANREARIGMPLALNTV